MLITAPSVAALAAGAWRWTHFTPAEFACKGTGIVQVESGFMDRLEKLRTRFGFPMIVNSGYRSPAYNDAVSSSGLDGAHTTGQAGDFKVYGARAFLLVDLAFALGFTGIGLQQKGPDLDKRFVHLDDVTGNPAIPRPAIWTY